MKPSWFISKKITVSVQAGLTAVRFERRFKQRKKFDGILFFIWNFLLRKVLIENLVIDAPHFSRPDADHDLQVFSSFLEIFK